MDPPPLPDIGQPDSYTSSLLPGSGEQSSPVSDFTSEMDPFLTLPVAAQEAPQSVQNADSLREASPVDPHQPSPHGPQQELQQSSNSSSVSSSCYSTGFKLGPNPNPNSDSNKSAGLVTTNRAFPHPQSSSSISSRQMWNTPPVEDLDPYCFGDSPTCGSGTSNTSNLSPVSPTGTGTWSSPATSFQPTNDQPLFETWADARYSTPTSDVFPGATSEIPPRCNGLQDSFDLSSSSDWHCEPLATSAALSSSDFHGLVLPSCPSSPAVMPNPPAAYMVQTKVEAPTPASFDMDMLSTKAPEPPAMALSSSITEANATTVATTATPSGEHTPYAQLIYRALRSAPEYSMSLQDLYTWFQKHTQKCKPGEKGWMNSIRHNLSMNAGFVKRDRKRASGSMTPDIQDGARGNHQNDSKRSTEWTLTDDAIEGGIQSTTRYRNKKNDGRDNRARGAHLGFYQPTTAGSGHSGGNATNGARYGFAANSRIGTSARGRDHPGRISKAYRHGTQQQQQQHHLRVAGTPSAAFLSRTSSPAAGSYNYHHHPDALLAAAGQTQSPVKLEPGMTLLTQHQDQDPYGMMITDHPPGFVSGSNGPISSSMYMPGTSQHAAPHGTFAYDPSNLQMVYPGLDGGATNMAADGIYDFTGQQGY